MSRSRFDPTVEQMRESIRSANDKYLRLSERIGAARTALKSGAPMEAVLAILDGKEAAP